MSVKLIVTDMDGTLLDDDHVTIPAANIAALQKARARGIQIAIASGRTWSLITDAAEQLGGIDYAILSNGSAIRWVAEGRTCCENGMPFAQSADLLRRMTALGLPVELYCRGESYAALADRERMPLMLVSEQFKSTYMERTHFVPDLVEALEGGEMEKINIFYVPPQLRDRAQAEAEATGPVTVTNSLGGNMEIAHGSANKGAALKALAGKLGLGPEEVMVFGDANNDLEMLSWAGLSFAMGNATAEAKAAAKFETAANVDAGVGLAVERFAL